MHEPTPILDEASARWLSDLRGESSVREPALQRLHDMLLRVARTEANRRRATLPSDIVADLDDLCLQAADDALAAISRKLPQFRGTSRFTTWAFKFVILEASARFRRRAWSGRRVTVDDQAWERFADPSPEVGRHVAERERLAAVKAAVKDGLTDRQRYVFVAALLDEVPIDAIAGQLDTTRGAVYKMLHDARRKVRAELVARGHMEAES